MVTVNCTIDGHQYRNYDATNKVALSATTGGWEQYAYADTTAGTSAPQNYQVLTGYSQNEFKVRFNPCFVFENVAIARGANINSASLSLNIAWVKYNVIFGIKSYVDQTLPLPSDANLPDSQPKTYEIIVYNMAYKDPNDYTGDGLQWHPTTNPAVIDIKPLLQEIVNQTTWDSGGRIILCLLTFDYQGFEDPVLNNFGQLAIYSTEHPTQAEAKLNYTVTTTPTITSVSSDDSVAADEKNVAIVGTNLSGATGIKMTKGLLSFTQLVATNTSTLITFNMAGNVPVDTGYELSVNIGQEIATHTINVTAALGSNPDTGTGGGLTDKDGHEYAASGSGFPGVWETESSLTSMGFDINDRILIGAWNNNIFKANITIGPLAIANSAVIANANLNLAIDNCYKYTDLRIKAVANPNAAAIGPSNIISSQTLTAATASSANSTWTNADGTSYWTPAPNPKNIDVRAIVQAVVNHVNWSSGDSIQFVLDYDPTTYTGGLQGHMRLFTNDNTVGQATTFNFTVSTGVSITSVSGDNIIELGELACTIVGLNLTGASNLVITKGIISESQTILTNTSTNIIFNVNTGAIVPDTGYTLRFDIAAVTYSTTVSFVEGGGVNTGNVGAVADGHEYAATLPSISNPGTFAEEYAAIHAVYIGQPDSNTYIATSRIGPISAQRGQSFTQADLTWDIYSSGLFAYKYVDFRIYAVANPAVAELGAGNLPSQQTLTAAYVTVLNSTWAGSSGSDFWNPSAEVIDISTVVAQVVNHANWVTGSYIQLVMVPVNYPGGSGYVAFGSKEGNLTLSLDYQTGAATNIANINGNNILKVGDTGVVLAGNDLGSATALTITNGAFSQAQTILSNTSTQVTFNFVQGQLGYGASTLRLTKGGIGYDFAVTLAPASTKGSVTLVTPGKGDNSLTYNESPVLVAGDIIEYDILSANGFTSLIDSSGIPTIQGGTEQDTLVVRGYDKSTGTWFDAQTITFLGETYFVRNIAPTLSFSSITGDDAVIIDSDVGEVWIEQNDVTEGEVWIEQT